MRRSSVFLLVLTVVLALAGVLAGAAMAGLPTLLPGTATITTAASTSTPTTLITLAGTGLICNKQESTWKAEKEGKLGPVHFDFQECGFTIAGVKVKCTGLGDTTLGLILVLGEFHLVYDKLGTGSALGVGVLLLFPSGSEPHWECPSGGTLYLLKGALLCLVTPVNTKIKTTEFYTLKCEGSTGGDQTESYWNSAGTATILPSLLFTVGTGSPESAATKGEMKLTSTIETEIMG